MSRRLIACALVLVCFLTGCANDDQYPTGIRKEFQDITLAFPGDFSDLSAEEVAKDADFMFGRKTLVVKGLKENKETVQAASLAAYTQQLIRTNGLSCTADPNGDGYLFTYEKELNGTTYSYTTATFEGAINFWILQFYGPKDDLQENQPEIDIILESLQKKP